MGKKKEKKGWAELIWLVASAVCVAFLLSPTPPPPPPPSIASCFLRPLALYFRSGNDVT